MADRVDKAWQKNGLDGYSTGAILATLGHYGVTVDEAGFKEASKDAMPAEVASAWLKTWKGTGQFKDFPYAAAVALYRRAWPDRLVPTQFAEVLAKLIVTLRRKLDSEDASVPTDPDFEAVSACAAKLPAEPEARARFLDEAVMHLGEDTSRTFDQLAEELGEEGYKEDALRFAALEEQLLPEREGVASAIARAALGERQEALAQVEAIVSEPSATAERKVMAIDALIHLEELEKARAATEPLLEVAEKEQDFHLGLALCERLAHLYDKLSAWDALQKLADRAQALARAHDLAHPHHH